MEQTHKKRMRREQGACFKPKKRSDLYTSNCFYDWQKEASYTPVVVPAEQAKSKPAPTQAEAAAAADTSKTVDETPPVASATLAADIR